MRTNLDQIALAAACAAAGFGLHTTPMIAVPLLLALIVWAGRRRPSDP